MIIKIKQTNKSDGWFIFDNAGDVAYSRHPKINAFFHDSMGQEAEENVVGFVDGTDLNHTQGSFFDNTKLVASDTPPGPGWYLSFTRNGYEQFEFWGDTEVYILNDAGKTIERVF